MEKGTLLSFFKPINSPKTAVVEAPVKEKPSEAKDQPASELAKQSVEDPDYDPKGSTDGTEKRKRKKESGDEKPEPRKRIKKSVDQDSPVVKRNSIQNFFKKIVPENTDKNTVNNEQEPEQVPEKELIEVVDEKPAEKQVKTSPVKSNGLVIESSKISKKSSDVSKKPSSAKQPKEVPVYDSDSSVTVDMEELLESVRKKGEQMEEIEEVDEENAQSSEDRADDENAQSSEDQADDENAQSPKEQNNEEIVKAPEVQVENNAPAPKEYAVKENAQPSEEQVEENVPATDDQVDTKENAQATEDQADEENARAPKDQKKSPVTEKKPGRNAFSLLMNKKKPTGEKDINVETTEDSTEKDDAQEDESQKATNATESVEAEENKDKNAFAFMMKKRPRKEIDSSTKEDESKEECEKKKTPPRSSRSRREKKDIKPENDVKEETVPDTPKDPKIEGDKEELKKSANVEQSPAVKNLSGRSNEPLDTPSRRVKDEKLSKMLSVLECLKDDDDDDVEPMEIDFTPKIKKKRRKHRSSVAFDDSAGLDKLSDSSTTPREKKPLRRSLIINEDKENHKENVNGDQGLQGVYTVICKGKEAQFDFDKFVSGGQGSCILYQNQWITPNQFERLAGSRAKKYKVSLYINKKPLQDWLTSHDSCGSSSASGRSTPLAPSSQNTQKLLTSAVRKIRKSKLTEVSEEADNEPVPEPAETPAEAEADPDAAGGSSRRSGRIARNLDKLEEKRKAQEEVEKRLKDLDAKENERKKKGRLVMLPGAVKVPPEAECVDLGTSSESESESEEESKPKSKEQSKPSVKLASIFMTKKKVMEDPAKVAARRAFLMSSAPEELRTQLKEAQAEEFYAEPTDFSFPKVTHIQQVDEDPLWSTKLVLNGLKEVNDANSKVVETDGFDKSFIDQSPMTDPLSSLSTTSNKLATSDVRSLVSSLKQKLDFPVNRIFRRLLERRLQTESKELSKGEKVEETQDLKSKKRKRKSKEVEVSVQFNTDRSSGEEWSSKYRPRCTEDMITNLKETRRLGAWLCNWSRPRARGSSQSSSSASESEGEEGSVDGGHCALLTGGTGCGKTAAVYALAEELGLHVLEVNASSCRTGKQVTSMLLEATQSEQVKTNQSKLNFFKPKVENNPQKMEAEKKGRKALILFEDIDIFFEEQDRGFYNAVNTICAATKRPIVLTSSDTTCVNLINKTIKSRVEHFRFDPSMEASRVAHHLQLMCLAEGMFVSGSSLRSLVSNSHSVRDAIIRTQFLVQSSHLQEVESNEPQEEIGRKSKKNAKRFTLPSAAKEAESSQGSDLSDEEESFSKYFPTSKSSRGSKVQKYKLTSLDPPVYCHTNWFQRISSTCSYQPLKKAELFPLDDAEEIKSVSGMEEVLRRTQPLSATNPDIYDAEGSDADDKQVKEVTEKKESAAVENMEVDEKASLRSKIELEAISKHLDNVSEFSSLHGEGVDQDLGIEDTIIQLSASASLRKLDIGQRTTEDLESYSLPTKEYIQEAEDEVLDAVLAPQLLQVRDRMDTLAGLRNILRSEECRRILCREGRRGGRFYHYFAKTGVVLSKPATNTLCNSLL